MEAELQTHIAFYLTGKRPGAGLDAVEGLDLRPALFAGYRDLTRLRYDFPLVLVRDRPERVFVQCLSGVVDGVVHDIAQDDNGDRVTKHVLRLEQEMRALLATGAAGSLSALWDKAASRLLAARADDLLKDSLARARAALKIDGEVIDCGRAMPSGLLKHAWAAVQQDKARRFRDDLERLILKLSDILQADFARSEAGRSAKSLKAGFGTLHEEAFDFGAMSRLLAKALPAALLPESRRERIHRVRDVLESQRFFPAPGAARKRGKGSEPYGFVFERCTDALAAYRERLPKAIELAKAIAIAELEIAGEYNAAKHDPFFDEFGANGPQSQDLALLPDYLVCVGSDKMDAVENATLMEILSAGLPMKILVQTDDILEPSPIDDGHLVFGLRSRQLTHMAIGLNEVYVLQSAGSHLFQFRDRILKALTYSGPALFSVFSGATGKAGDLPPYLTAAAAMESRAFPAFVYDPSAGPNWAARFYLEANPQVDLDWPVQRFAYEDEAHQNIAEDVAFTLVDFIACDARYARHFAKVPRAKWNGSLAPVTESLAREPKGLPEKIPSVLMVDRNDVLQKVIVDDKLMRAARRCRETWHSLQELGGIHNSHAEKLLARERQAWEETEQRREAEAKKPGPAADAATAQAAAPAPAEPEEQKSADDPYIETPRCTSCNECTKLNDKMFAYDANKQAYIANPDAGTYAQLVEAAESCQVSVIHPGKPRNPNEPGLEDLIKRAEPFL